MIIFSFLFIKVCRYYTNPKDKGIKKFEFHLTVSRLLRFNKHVRNVEAFSYLSETEEFTKTLIYSASLLLKHYLA